MDRDREIVELKRVIKEQQDEIWELMEEYRRLLKERGIEIEKH